jgi:diguanylate cyclase (GGDEF)-like protein/PAS domain S-box-containing protein
MKKLSLRMKILMIFLIPTIALIYFSTSFVQDKYRKLNESAMYKLAAETTEDLSVLIHNIQIERGLSFGYLVSKTEKNSKKEIAKRQKKTDDAYEKFVAFVHSGTDEKEAILHIAGSEYKPTLSSFIAEYGRIEELRGKILNRAVDARESLEYYTQLNQKLLKLITLFMLPLQRQNGRSCALPELENLKESAGLERAYIYHELLSENYDSRNLEIIKELEKKQTLYQEQFALNAPVESLLIFNDLYQYEIEERIAQLRKDFFARQLHGKDAIDAFKLLTLRIDIFEKISSKILGRYMKLADESYRQAMYLLYFTAALWILSIVSLLGLTYLLRRLIINEERYTEELRISAYTFDSHEAITITDVKGAILKVNDAFTRITGYEASEVIGKNPNILKSMKHSEDFYREMWRQINASGKWSGEIYNKRKNGEIYMERLSITAIKNDQGITTHYIAQFLDVSDIKKMQEQAQHQADHDFLTGLLNRKSLMQRLQEEFVKAKRHNFVHAFMFIDLDKFKMVNDSYGHAVGDKLLVEVGRRLKSLLREEDVLARMSGDEFAVIVVNMEEHLPKVAQVVKGIATKIVEEIGRPYTLDGYQVTIGASVGIKIFPDGEKDSHAVVVHADTAMYQAKHQGKNQFVFFDKNIEKKLQYFQVIEAELHQAIDNNEFVFYYQPKVDIKSGCIAGAEALMRWEHPEKGLLYPDAFLHVAAEIGMSHRITLLVLTRVCQFLRKHQNVFKGTIAVNIHAGELLELHFEKEIMGIIGKYGIDPSRIELEITENELIRDFNAVVVKIKRLKEFGVKFAIDDFGTGYSSITYLKKLPIDTLKIDKAFLDNLANESNRELVRLIINMAKNFNICTVIEGVESQSQLDFISENGADLYQGYIFSKAVNESRFLSLLHSSSAAAK